MLDRRQHGIDYTERVRGIFDETTSVLAPRADEQLSRLAHAGRHAHIRTRVGEAHVAFLDLAPLHPIRRVPLRKTARGLSRPRCATRE